jgi:ubiquinone/menaquinone biosynthesis C-methylase UbiE
MGVPFDHLASISDSLMSRTITGQLQRKYVWKYIESVIPQLNGYEMLEINTGSGEDAILFSEQDFNMIATDISAETLRITLEKPDHFLMANNISSHYLDFDNLNTTLFDKKFDLVFSNFDSLNNTSPESLQALFRKLPQILNPGGRFIGVVMPRFCAWESFYFMLTFNFRRAFKRMTSKAVISTVRDLDHKTWFYSPSQLKRWSKEKFKIVNIQPIGIALPPVTLDHFFRFKKTLLNNLNFLEKKLEHVSFLANFSDHFVIDLQLR